MMALAVLWLAACALCAVAQVWAILQVWAIDRIIGEKGMPVFRFLLAALLCLYSICVASIAARLAFVIFGA